MSQNRKFQHYTVYAKVGQLKVNNNQVMCHLSMKLSDTFDRNPPCTFDNITEKPTLRAKVKVIAKIKNQCPREQKTCLPKKL